MFSSGAFAKRDLPKNAIVTGTPLLVFPDKKWFNMYDFQICPNYIIAPDITRGPIGQQLLLNYCFGHSEITVILCPVSKSVKSNAFYHHKCSC